MWNGNSNFGSFYQPGQYGYNGYSNPAYPQPQPSAQPSVQQPAMNTNKLYANGIEDVRFRQLPVNSDYIFLDNDKPLVYRKTTDATGKTDIQVFKIVPYVEEEKAQPDIDLSKFVPIDRFEELEKQFKELKDSLGG